MRRAKALAVPVRRLFLSIFTHLRNTLCVLQPKIAKKH